MTKRTYAVWGTRAVGQWLAEEIIRLGDRVSVYCSSSKTSQGKLINGTPVISPEKLKDLCSKQEITHIVLGMVSESHKQKVREILKCEFPKGIHIINSDDIQNQYLLNVRSQWNNSWHIDFQNQGTIWLQNFMKEVEYWVQYVVNPNGRDHHTYHEWLSNADFAGIDKTCTILEPTLRDGSVVLDLGSGLVSKYGTRLPDNKTIQLVPVDALAYFYNKINQKYAPGKIQTCNFGMFEFIADFYSENNFDAIVISNALDHYTAGLRLYLKDTMDCTNGTLTITSTMTW